MIRRIHLVDDGRVEIARQLVARTSDLVADVLGGDLDVPVELELDDDGRPPLGRGRAERTHTGDGVQVLLEDVGDVLLHHLGARPLELGAHRDHRVFHLGELVDAEAGVSEQSEDDEGEDQHPGEDGTPDEEVDGAHGMASAVSPAALTAVETRVPSAFRGETRAPSTRPA